MDKKSARWVAALSNGEVIVENTGAYIEVPGEPSPWQKLLKHLEEKNLEIRALQIRVNGRTYTLPSFNPKFGGLIPKSFKYFRKVATDVYNERTENIERYICIEAIYDSFSIRLWVDEMGMGHSWVSVEPLDK